MSWKYGDNFASMAWKLHAIEQMQLRRRVRRRHVGRPKFDFHTGVQFARVVTQPLLVEAEAIIGRRSFPRGGPLGRRRRGKTYREITRELSTIVLRANGQLVAVVAVPAAPAVSALVGRAPEASPWFVRRRGVVVEVPEGAVAGSRAIVSLPDDGSARHATVTIAFPPGLSTGQELTVALEV